MAGVAEGLGVEVDHRRAAVGAEHHRRVAHEGAGVGPEPRRVEGRDVAAALLGGGEVGGQPVGVEALAHEVVGRLRGGRVSMPAMRSLSKGSGELNSTRRSVSSGCSRASIWIDRAAEVAAAQHDPSRPRPSVTRAWRSADVGGARRGSRRGRGRCHRSRGGRGRSRRTRPPPAARSPATRCACSPASRARTAAGPRRRPRARRPGEAAALVAVDLEPAGSMSVDPAHAMLLDERAQSGVDVAVLGGLRADRTRGSRSRSSSRVWVRSTRPVALSAARSASVASSPSTWRKHTRLSGCGAATSRRGCAVEARRPAPG